MTTLIVDDDPFVIKLLTRQLTSLGVTGIDGQTDSSAALTAIADTPALSATSRIVTLIALYTDK